MAACRRRCGAKRGAACWTTSAPAWAAPTNRSTAISGPLGSAAACSNLLGLSTEQTATAISVAASQAAGLRDQFGTMTKSFHVGNAARSGLIAALLAEQGFTASTTAIEAER